MVSTRTKYRYERIDLITDIIRVSATLLLLYKKELEMINLPQLKRINREIHELRTEASKFSAA